MGYQQLLLLVLGTVIAGIAVVVGIDAFERNHRKANLDALVNDGLRMAGEVQSWKASAPLYGGGANQSWNELTWSDLGYSSSPEKEYYETPNGYFELSVTDDGHLQLIGKNDEQQNKVTVTVKGLGPERIITIARSL